MAIQTEPITGKVARILNEREVALNIGGDDGVELDMLFDIMSPKGYDIEDPDSGEVLGSVLRPKIRVKVIQVQDRVAVASTYKTQRVNVGGIGPGFGNLFLQPPRWETRIETLHKTDTTQRDISEADSYVSTGDPVVQAFEDSQEERG